MLGHLRTAADEPPRFVLSRWLFLRLLAVTYFIAFASLTPQISGLVGTNGLLPIAQYLERAFELWGAEAYYRLPTLLWLWPSDVLLLALCWLGMGLALVAVVGITPIASFAALWVLYLSLTIAGQDFLSFQWDVLLLEAGVLAVFYCPLGWRPPLVAQRRPSAAARWLIWGLAFKLIFLSGVTKLLSGDPTWRNFTALQYHYETQPIPTWTSWYLHNAPEWFGTMSVGLMFVIEIAVPFVIFFPPRFRLVRALGCATLCLLQIVIALSGNYGFFNLLTVALYLSLLDDVAIASVLPRYVSTPGAPHAEPPLAPRPWRVAVAGITATLALLSVLSFVRELRRPNPMPAWAGAMLGWVAPTRSVNGYGLFRTMTVERPEIVIEGTADGETWQEYGFTWKAGDVARAPGFVQPHMPRLDWQMWFAALGPQQHAHWLFPLAERLLENDPTALGLLDTNPFPDTPPRLIRFAMYRYHFTTPDEGLDGDWWRRDFIAYLTEPISRRR